MNIKKIIATTLAGVMATGMLSSCTLLPQKEESTTATTTETTTAAPNFDNYNMAYEEYLFTIFAGEEKLVGYEYEIADCRFKLVDLDLNNVPELLISEGEFDNSKVNIYTYDGYEVKFLESIGNKGNMLFSQTTGIIGAYEVTEDGEFYQETHTAYSLNGYKINTDWVGVTRTKNKDIIPIDFGKSYDDEIIYVSDDEQIPAEDFATLCAKYIPEDMIEIGRDGFELTEDNVIAVIEKGEEEITTTVESTENTYESEIELDEKEKTYYGDVLYDFLTAENYTENSKFTLAYIDDDSTPELIISTGDDHGTGAMIYTIKDSSALQVIVAGQNGVAGYLEKEGIIVGKYESEGVTNITVYELGDGEITTKWEGMSVKPQEEGKETEYSSDGETVTKEDYQKNYDKYISQALIYNTTDGKITGEPEGYSINRETLDKMFALELDYEGTATTAIE